MILQSITSVIAGGLGAVVVLCFCTRYLRKHSSKVVSSNPRLFILDKLGKPIQVENSTVWAAWFAKSHKERAIATFSLNKKGSNLNFVVCTVFLGVDHNMYDVGPPLLYETAVFGGILDGERILSATKEEAKRAHEKMIQIQKALIQAHKLTIQSQAGKDIDAVQ